MTTAPPHSRPVLLVAVVWFAVATVLSATGRIAALRPPVPQLVLVGLTFLVLLAAVVIPGFKAWLRALDLRAYVALHLTRFVGAYFLVLYARGELPYAFAVPGGWGDILVATLALLLLLLGWDLSQRRSLLTAWNFLGLADILFVVGTAARLALADPPSMQALLRFPLSLLPTFLVPLIIASHVVLFWRLSTEPRGL